MFNEMIVNSGGSGAKVFETTITGTTSSMTEYTVDVGFTPKFVYMTRSEENFMQVWDVDYSTTKLRYYKGTSENGTEYTLPYANGIIVDISGSIITYRIRAPYVIKFIAIG